MLLLLEMDYTIQDFLYFSFSLSVYMQHISAHQCLLSDLQPFSQQIKLFQMIDHTMIFSKGQGWFLKILISTTFTLAHQYPGWTTVLLYQGQIRQSQTLSAFLYWGDYLFQSTKIEAWFYLIMKFMIKICVLTIIYICLLQI